MQSKVVALTSILALLAIGSLTLFRPAKAGPKLTSNSAKIPDVQEQRELPPPASTRHTAAVEPDNQAQFSNDSIAETNHQKYVADRLKELRVLSMKEDSQSLQSILEELTNRDPDIRSGALEAAIQFGSRDAIPRIIEAESQTDDPKEKTALEEAVEFLKLPTISEALQKQRSPTNATVSAGRTQN